MSNPNQPPPYGPEVERPIIFRWRRADGTVLIEDIVSSQLPLSDPVGLARHYGSSYELPRLEPDDVVEYRYRFPDSDWQPAVLVTGTLAGMFDGAWTIREAT